MLHLGSDDTFPLGAGYAEVYTLAVLPEARDTGIGTALLDAVDAALADRAIPSLTVAVLPQNEATIRLYRRRGLIPGELIMYRIWQQFIGHCQVVGVPSVRDPSLRPSRSVSRVIGSPASPPLGFSS